MSNHLYNYSISLIRRSNSSWIIDPVDSSAQAVYKEILALKPGNSYLAVKTVGELTFVECYTKHYADFSGRARRREYWGTVLFNILSYLLLVLISSLLFGVLGAVQGSLNQTLMVLQSMVLFLLLVCSVLPSLAVAVRRLHDTGRSGWYYLLIVIPFIGPLLFLFWMCSDSQSEENEYGPNPKA